MDRFRGRGIHGPHKVLVHHLGQEWREGSQDLRQRGQHLVQRLVRRCLVASLSLFQKRRRLRRMYQFDSSSTVKRSMRVGRAVRIVAVQRGADFGDQLVQARDDPAVEQRPLGQRHSRRPGSMGSKPSSRA